MAKTKMTRLKKPPKIPGMTALVKSKTGKTSAIGAKGPAKGYSKGKKVSEGQSKTNTNKGGTARTKGQRATAEREDAKKKRRARTSHG
jgi:hypothetical protein